MSKLLYKFRSFDENHLRLLTHNELFFSSPANFNDPFDSRIPIRYDIGTQEQIVAWWTDRLSRLHPEIPEEERIGMANDFYNQGTFRTDEGIQKARQVAENFATTQIGVCALSTDFRNLLLWSHYARSHTGFAVGLNSVKLKAFCRRRLNEHQDLIAPAPVNYDPTYPVINAYTNSLFERLKGQLLTKAVDWKYETEYRLIRKDGLNTTLPLEDAIIERVILGCQASEVLREIVIAVLTKRKYKPYLYEATVSKSSFKLEFRLLSY